VVAGKLAGVGLKRGKFNHLFEKVRPFVSPFSETMPRVVLGTENGVGEGEKQNHPPITDYVLSFGSKGGITRSGRRIKEGRRGWRHLFHNRSSC